MSDHDHMDGVRDALAGRADDDALWAIFSTSRNGMLLADDDRNYVNANAAACALLGYDVTRLRTMRIDDITVPELRPLIDGIWDDFLARGGAVGRFAVLRADGSRLDFEFNATANVTPGLHLSLFISPEVVGEALGLDEDTHEPKRNLVEPVPVVVARTGTVLDPEERTVITLFALGRNWHEVADEIGRPPADVRAVMESAMGKLGAQTRAHAVSIAIRAGEIDLADAPPG